MDQNADSREERPAGTNDARVRDADPGEAEAIFDLMVRAFGVEEGSERWHQWRGLAFGQVAHFEVLDKGGRIIGAALVRPERLRLAPDGEIVKGEVGEVCVLPEFQGQGYGHRLMQGVVEAMRRKGCDISRLGGYIPFYRRFGYVPFPRRYVLFPVEPVQGGVRTIAAAEMFGPPEGLPGSVRPYDPARDAGQIQRVYGIFYGARTGAVVREMEPHDAKDDRPASPTPVEDLDPLKLVYEVDGRIEGYLMAADLGRDVTPFEARITVGEAAYDPARPDAIEGLLKQLLHEALKRSARRVTARLPFDAQVLDAIRDAGIGFELQEMQGTHAGNMIRIVDLCSLLIRIAPTLTWRLRATGIRPSSTTVEIACAGEQAILRMDEGGEVEAGGGGKADLRISPDPATLLKLILGILSFEEAVLAGKERMDARMRSLLSAWFPRQPCTSGPWG